VEISKYNKAGKKDLMIQEIQSQDKDLKAKIISKIIILHF